MFRTQRFLPDTSLAAKDALLVFLSHCGCDVLYPACPSGTGIILRGVGHVFLLSNPFICRGKDLSVYGGLLVWVGSPGNQRKGSNPCPCFDKAMAGIILFYIPPGLLPVDMLT
jgi:hypothetical protein